MGSTIPKEAPAVAAPAPDPAPDGEAPGEAFALLFAGSSSSASFADSTAARISIDLGGHRVLLCVIYIQ